MVGRTVTAQRFTVSFDGPALQQHTIDAKDFASSVLALADVFHEAQEILTPLERKAKLAIQATAPGSFEVVLQLVVDGWAATREWLLGPDAEAIGKLEKVLWPALGAFALIQSLKGRKVNEAVSNPGREGEVDLRLEDGTTLATTPEKSRLIQDLDFRRAVEDVVAPLESEGIDYMALRSEGTTSEITKADLPSFRAPDVVASGEVEEAERITNLQLIGLDFGETRKWRFTEGNAQPFSAAMLDNQFREDIENNIVHFGKHDILKVLLLTRQSVDKSGKLRMEYEVLQVIDHITAGRQQAFNFQELDFPEPESE